METKTKKIIEFLEHENTKWSHTITEELESDFDIFPQDFLKYAELDLATKNDHKIVNALSNSKRAIDCQVDLLLLAFGFYKLSQKKFWGFPTKLDYIEKLGVIAPRILKKINKKRNLLEHQFVKPTKEDVEDMLDIAMLFVASTEKYTLRFSPFVNLKNEEFKNQYLFNLDYKNREIVAYEFPIDYRVNISDLEKNKPKLKSSIHWKQGEEDYSIILKRYLEITN